MAQPHHSISQKQFVKDSAKEGRDDDERSLIRVDMSEYIDRHAVARAQFATLGYDSQYAARPLKRALRRYVEDPPSEHILSAQLGSSERSLRVDWSEEMGWEICSDHRDD